MYGSILRLSELFVKLAEELATVDSAKVRYPSVLPELNPELLDDKIKEILKRKQFNYDEFSELQTIKEVKEYIDSTLFPIFSAGKQKRGTSRMAYGLEDNVLKVAINQAGIAQNNMEARIQNRSELFTKVFDMHPRALWIIVEKVYPFENIDEFEHHTGIPKNLFSSKWLYDVIRYKFTKSNIKNLKKYNLSDDAIKTLIEIGDIINLGVIYGDARNPEHWGLNKFGDLKLFDFGLDSTMHSNFYTHEGFLKDE